MTILEQLSAIIETGSMPLKEDVAKFASALKSLYRLGITNILNSMGMSGIEDFLRNVDERTFAKAKSNVEKLGLVECVVIEESFLDVFKGQNRNVLIMTAILALVGLTGESNAFDFGDFGKAATSIATTTQKALNSKEAKAIGQAVAKGAEATVKATGDQLSKMPDRTQRALDSKEAKAIGRGIESAAKSTGEFTKDQISKMPERFKLIKNFTTQEIAEIKMDMDRRNLEKEAERQRVMDKIFGEVWANGHPEETKALFNQETEEFKTSIINVLDSTTTRVINDKKSEIEDMLPGGHRSK